MSRNLGVMGETIFKAFCASVGIVANKSEQDEFGWDYYLEFPYSKNNLSLDFKRPIECKVQVKSTDKKEKKLAIKVSVLDRLVKYPLPSFIVFLEFEGKNRVQSIYIKHIDKEVIYKTLKRCRELSVKNKPLHKSTIVIHYGDCKIDEISGEGIKRAIQKYIPNGIDYYVKWKEGILNSVGYDEGYGVAEITFEDFKLEDIINLSLGLRDTPLNLKDEKIKFTFKERRFGIEQPFGRLFSQSAVMESISVRAIPPEKENALIVISQEDKVIDKIPAKIIASPFNTERLSKVLVDTEVFLITLVLDKERGNYLKFKSKYDYQKAQPLLLNDILKYFEILDILASKDNLGQKIIVKGESLITFQLDKENIDTRIVTLYKVAKMFREILDKVEEFGDCELQRGDLENNYYTLSTVYHIFQNNLDNIKVSFQSEEYSNLEDYDFTLYTPFMLYINKQMYSIWLILTGKVASDGYNHQVLIRKAKLKKTLYNNKKMSLEEFYKEYKEFDLQDSSKDRVSMFSDNLIKCDIAIER